MIDTNLNFLIQFLKRDELVTAIEQMKIRSTELQIAISSAEKTLFSGKVEEVKFQCKSSIIKQLSSKQKIDLYCLIRILKNSMGGENWFSVLYADITEFYSKIGIKQNLRYLYLTELTENMFNYEMDVILWSKTQRTNFFRRIGNPVIVNEKVKFNNLWEVLIAIIKTFKIKICFKNTPKRKQFRKGYNDHGSLGSEYSQTLKQQASDWSLNEKEEKEKKRVHDFLQLSLGLNGWI